MIRGNRNWIYFAATAVFACGLVHAQNLISSLSEAYQPRFQDLSLFLDPDFKGSMTMGLRVGTTYSSNLKLSEDDPISDLLLNISPSFAYRSDPNQGAPFSLEVGYTPDIKVYQKSDDLDGFNQAARAVIKYAGAKAMLSTFVAYDEISGSDRLAQDYVEGASTNFGATASYQIAPRTSIQTNIGGAISTYKTGQEETRNYTAGLSANWAYSEHLGFGPSFSYSNQQSALTGTRQSYSVTGQMNYKLDERISFTSSTGLQISRDSRLSARGARLGFTGDLSANYAIGNRWRWFGSMRYNTLPSPSVQNYFIQDLTLSTGLNHQLNHGSLGASVDWSNSTYQQVGPILQNQEDSTFTSFMLTYNRGVFNDRANLSSSVKYSLSRGDRDYSQLQLSIALDFRF